MPPAAAHLTMRDAAAARSSPTAPLSATARSTVRRGASRARTDRAELYAVLDAGLVCHLGVVLGDAPVVLPTAYGAAGIGPTRSTCTGPPAPAPCARPPRAHRSA